jgi:hypothetical protein
MPRTCPLAEGSLTRCPSGSDWGFSVVKRTTSPEVSSATGGRPGRPWGRSSAGPRAVGARGEMGLACYRDAGRKRRGLSAAKRTFGGVVAKAPDLKPKHADFMPEGRKFGLVGA